MNILIIEDDLFYAQRISELLQDEGARTSIFTSAEEAMKADVSQIDGAIIDLMLPNDSIKSGISEAESRGGFRTGLVVARRLMELKQGIKIVMFSSAISEEVEAWTRSRGIPFVSKSDGYHALLRALGKWGLIPGTRTPLAFIVHGHDSSSLFELKNYIQNSLKWQEPLVLRDQPSRGKTLIEKFEDYSRRIDCVFVLLTPDDAVVQQLTDDSKRRSRQNVVFEAGFFYGALERKSGKILLLHKGPVELPSDISGVVWIDIQNGIQAAGEEIRKETTQC